MRVTIFTREDLKRRLNRYYFKPEYHAIISIHGLIEREFFNDIFTGVKDIKEDKLKQIKLLDICINEHLSIEDAELFHTEDFNNIANYVYKCYLDKVPSILIECANDDFKRSGAVAAAIDECINHNGIKYFLSPDILPNKAIYNNLYKELRRVFDSKIIN